MLLADVNVLVYAFRADAPNHNEYREWLERTCESDEAYGLTDLVCSGFLRVVTHPRIFSPPSPMDRALTFLEALRNQPNCFIVAPRERHWRIFSDLSRVANARGNLVPDAYLAALAIESGSEWISTDGDYARFPDLRWRRPFP